jgi:hypothetical protein
MTIQTQPKWIIDGVRVSNLLHVWDDCWPYLERAVNRIPDLPRRHNEAMILSKLYKRQMQLWVAWDVDRNRACGAVVTEIIGRDDHPDKTFLSIPFVGGEGWNNWGDAMWTLLKQWGAHHGCTHALGYGRKGWKRLYGFVDCGKTSDGVPMFVRTLKGIRA